SYLLRGAHFHGSRSIEFDLPHGSDMTRALGHYDHTIRQDHCLRNRVGNEYDGLSLAAEAKSLAPDSQEFEIHIIACHGVERAEWSVHQQQRWIEQQR